MAQGRKVHVTDAWNPCSAGKDGTSIGGRCSLILRTAWDGCVEDMRVSTGRDKVGMPSAHRESLVSPMGQGDGSAGNKEESVNRRGESERLGWREGSGEYCDAKSKG